MTIYFIQQGDDGPIKIGYTKGDAYSRCTQLQCGNPVKLNVIGSRPGTFKDEAVLHRRHSRDRMVGEWFYPSDAILNEAQDGQVYAHRALIQVLAPSTRPRISSGRPPLPEG